MNDKIHATGNANGVIERCKGSSEVARILAYDMGTENTSEGATHADGSEFVEIGEVLVKDHGVVVSKERAYGFGEVAMEENIEGKGEKLKAGCRATDFLRQSASKKIYRVCAWTTTCTFGERSQCCVNFVLAGNRFCMRIVSGDCRIEASSTV